MFESFSEHFQRDAQRAPQAPAGGAMPLLPGLNDFIVRFGGQSFADGKYRVPRPADLPRWNERIALAFPTFAGNAQCFGYDWLGRAFALDPARLDDGAAGVVVFDPGFAEVLYADANLETFHNREMVIDSDDVLLAGFYRDWRDSGGAAPAFDACVGYRVPMFLGGEDELANLEMNDLDVYWEIMGQMIDQTRDLPPGTRIGKVEITD